MTGGSTRVQIGVYAAIGIVLLLLGIRAVRESGEAEPGAGATGVRLATEPVGSGGPPASDGDVVVHVAGAVADPGVYRLPAGSRVADALERAGGPIGRADPDSINLAARLADGQQVVVPERVAAGAIGIHGDRPGRRGADQPGLGRSGRPRDHRGDRAGHGRGHPRLPRRARRRLLDRAARRDPGDRPDDDRGAERPAPAVTRAAGWWRHLALAGLVAGLLASPHLAAPAGWAPALLVAAAALAWLGRLAPGGRSAGALLGVRLLAISALGAVLGLGVGGARVEAIDAGALTAPTGAPVTVAGYVDAVPRRAFGEVRVPLETPDGRVMVVGREPIGPLPVGRLLSVEGRLRHPDPFRRGELERLGIALELEADRIELEPGGRGGAAGIVDGIRARAEEALGSGMGEESSALARGFVLGQDDLIDPATREAFKRSGLAHLLAVSGQNVMLLAILAGVLLGVAGVRLRPRLLLTVLLIAVYVPVAGAGPSIQRAGVVGAAAILATLAGRPAQRSYLVLLAAAATLLINPRFGSDVGWQLSFAAVVGIGLWAAPIRALLLPPLRRRLPDRLAGPLAEGIALTLAATLATAPLMAHHFEQASLAALPANLLALPLIAPVMWLGMLIALLGQVPAIPLGGLGWVEGGLVDLIARIARALADPAWAQLRIGAPGAAVTAAVYAALLALVGAAIANARRRRGLGIPAAARAGLAVLTLAGLTWAVLAPDPARGPVPPATLRITELDVGQGDATLLQPPHGAPLLIDGGPPGGAAAEALRELGIDRLRAVFLTHDELDHAGGLFEILTAVPAAELVHARPAPELAAAARAAGTRVLRTGEGSSFRFGRLQLDVLWPPRDAPPAADRNFDSLVMVARFAGYDALLTGDAEAEAVHLDPGPLDVLKVAHHGSDDAGLGELLDRSVPRIALIGVGAGNSYGHPTPETLTALAEHGVCTLRTDLDGNASVEIGPDGVRAWVSSGPPPADRAGCSGAGG